MHVQTTVSLPAPSSTKGLAPWLERQTIQPDLQLAEPQVLIVLQCSAGIRAGTEARQQHSWQTPLPPQHRPLPLSALLRQMQRARLHSRRHSDSNLKAQAQPQAAAQQQLACQWRQLQQGGPLPQQQRYLKPQLAWVQSPQTRLCSRLHLSSRGRSTPAGPPCSRQVSEAAPGNH